MWLALVPGMTPKDIIETAIILTAVATCVGLLWDEAKLAAAQGRKPWWHRNWLSLD